MSLPRLLAPIVDSGIIAQHLAGDSAALALLGNTLPTGAMLIVLITMLGPVSGAHLNPSVTLVSWLQSETGSRSALAYVAAQIAGAMVGVLLAHAMFEQSLLQVSIKDRSGLAQVFSEAVATFGLVLTILLTLRAKPQAVATSVGLYITAAYWFTASTSFANPAVTVARAMTDTFSGIRPHDAVGFIIAQLIGAAVGLVVASALAPRQAALTASCQARKPS